MANLPTVGGDTGTWGTVLNQYLEVSHFNDGYNKRTVSSVKTGPSYTVTDADDVIRVNNAAASVFIDLPTAVGRTGRRFTIVKTNDYTDTFACGVRATGGQTISGVDVHALYGEGDSLEVVSDGANWLRSRGTNPSQRTKKEWFVKGGLSSAGDGRTPQTSFNTFAEAIAAAGDGDTIYICSDLQERMVISKAVSVIGEGNQRVLGATGDTSIDNITVEITSDHVHFENFEIRGFNAFKGVHLALNGVSFARIVNIRITGNATPTSYPTSPAAGTGVGGVGVVQHRGEGCYYEQINISQCSIGFIVGEEASVNQVTRMTFSTCVQELVMGMFTGTIVQDLQPGPWAYGGGNGGGWVFIQVKSTNPQVAANTHVVDLIGGGTTNYAGGNNSSNVFVASDFSEGSLPTVRIGSGGNAFIRPVSSPQAIWHIEGQRNTFLNARILGAGWVIDSDYNIFDNFWSNGTFSGAGSYNTFRRGSMTNSGGPGMDTNFTGSRNVFAGIQYNHTGAGTDPALTALGTEPAFLTQEGVVVITYSGTMATDIRRGNYFKIDATNGTAFTISNPTDTSNNTPANIMATQKITYDIKNSSGGAMGAVTWGGAFLLAGAFTNPANTKRRTITFQYDGTNWVEVNRAAADI